MLLLEVRADGSAGDIVGSKKERIELLKEDVVDRRPTEALWSGWLDISSAAAEV